MPHFLFMMLFLSVVIADDTVETEKIALFPVEKMECIILRGDSVPTTIVDPVVVYPIEDFVRIEEGEYP